MRITVTVDELRDAIALARQVIPARPRLVAFGGVLLHVRGTALRAIGSDGDTTLAVDAGRGTGGRDGQVLLPPKPIADYLAHLDPTAAVTLELDDTSGVLAVTADGRPPYRFRPMQTTLQLPGTLRGEAVSVDWDRLPDALAAVEAAVGDDGAVQVVSDEDALTLHATDHYRLGRASLASGGFGPFTGVVDLQVLKVAARCAIQEVTVSADGKQLRLAGDRVVMTTRVLSVMFPAVDGVFAAPPPDGARVDRAVVARRLATLATVAGDEHLRLEFADGTVTMHAANTAIGEADEVIDVEQVGAPVTFGLKPAYLRQALAGQPSDRVTLAWSGPLNPVYLSSRDGDLGVTAVVMPVRLT